MVTLAKVVESKGGGKCSESVFILKMESTKYLHVM